MSRSELQARALGCGAACFTASKSACDETKRWLLHLLGELWESFANERAAFLSDAEAAAEFDELSAIQTRVLGPASGLAPASAGRFREIARPAGSVIGYLANSSLEPSGLAG